MALVTVEELKTSLGVGNLYSDEIFEQVIQAVDDVVKEYITTEAYDDEVAPVKEAALALCIDTFQARVSPGGEQTAVDMSVSPWRFGNSFISKVKGLLAPYLDEGMFVG